MAKLKLTMTEEMKNKTMNSKKDRFLSRDVTISRCSQNRDNFPLFLIEGGTSLVFSPVIRPLMYFQMSTGTGLSVAPPKFIYAVKVNSQNDYH